MIERFLPTRLKDRLETRKMKKNIEPLVPLEGMRYETIFTEEQIQARLVNVANEIIDDYQLITDGVRNSKEAPVLIPIANGAAFGATDIMRMFGDRGVDIPMEYIKISTYGKEQKSGGKPKKKFQINKELVVGREIVLMDDILDTGNTLDFVTKKLLEMGAKSVKTLVLLRKPTTERVEDLKHVEADYVGFSIPAVWVEGYGLDSKYFARGKRNIDAVYEDKKFTVTS